METETIDNLKTYLQIRFIRDNIPKYYHYFQQWFNNLTNDQLYYFNIDYEKSNS